VCFSAEASFGVGGVLVPAGVYCIGAALNKKPRYLALAAVPLFFGVQQIGEGFVWHAIQHDDSAAARGPSLFFLFFALAFWPFWFPFLASIMETCPKRRWFFIGLTLMSTVWFWVLYYPVANGPESLLTTKVVHHSIRYDYYAGVPVYQYVPRPVLQILYVATIGLPMALGSASFGRLPGLVLGASALIAMVLFEYAFVSVWCFFAAVLATYLVVVFYRLPNPLVKYSEPARAISPVAADLPKENP
jgi:hypothetical protein